MVAGLIWYGLIFVTLYIDILHFTIDASRSGSLFSILFSTICNKVQVGNDQERRNQKEIAKPKTEVGKN